MKSTFLFLLATTMMTCTAYGQSANNKENKLPDWAFGGFERPKNVNPVISPIENTKFYCPLAKDSIAWESNDTFNPAATLYNGEIVVLLSLIHISEPTRNNWTSGMPSGG